MCANIQSVSADSSMTSQPFAAARIEPKVRRRVENSCFEPRCMPVMRAQRVLVDRLPLGHLVAPARPA